jgi:AraC-like DNA-binding protein
MGEESNHTSEVPASSDVLSDVLRAVRLRGAVFYNVEGTAPWVAEAPDSHELAPFILPGAEQVIEYHVVVEGRCWMGIVGEPPVQVQAGDIVMFPQGHAHVVSSEQGMRSEAHLEDRKRDALGRLPVRVDLGGGGGERTRLVCGFWACDSRPFNPLLSALPRTLVTRGSAGGAHREMLDYFMKAAVAESLTPRAGGDAMLARLSELMFVEVVRQYVSRLEQGRTGWLSGLRDDVVGRALRLLHAKPAHAWTLDDLSREVGASRSALSERFTGFVDVPPMQYLAQWRMQLAASMLMSSANLAQIAAEVGYGSEAAFSRAFKKIVGVAPAGWRAARAK